MVKKLIVSLAVVMVVVGLDLASKSVVFEKLDQVPARQIKVVPQVFHLVHVENSGVTFGTFGSLAPHVRRPLLIVFPLLTMLFIIVLWFRAGRRLSLLALGLSLIVGGAIGNLVDRVQFDYVRDFLYVNLGFMWWPAFNVADAAVVIGMGLFVFTLIKNPSK